MSVAPGEDHEVMAAVDGEGPQGRLVIADLGAEDAWVAIGHREAPDLRDWR